MPKLNYLYCVNFKLEYAHYNFIYYVACFYIHWNSEQGKFGGYSGSDFLPGIIDNISDNKINYFTFIE